LLYQSIEITGIQPDGSIMCDTFKSEEMNSHHLQPQLQPCTTFTRKVMEPLFFLPSWEQQWKNTI